MKPSNLPRNVISCRHCRLMGGAHGTLGECIEALRGERERLTELLRGRPAAGIQVAVSTMAFDRDNAAMRARPVSGSVRRPRFVPPPMRPAPASTPFLYESRRATVGSTAVARLAGM